MIEGRATARYVRTSAQKAKLVMDLIRGQDVDRALSTLRFARKRIARDIEKVLRSAVANAQQKEGASGDADRMFVSSCYADQGPTMKRIRPAPMGRAFQIRKRTSHLTVHVAERPEVVKVVTPSPEPVEDAAPEKKTAAKGAAVKKKKTAAKGASGAKKKAPVKKKAAKKAAADTPAEEQAD